MHARPSKPEFAVSPHKSRSATTLEIGEAHDAFEREADRVADDVTANKRSSRWSISTVSVGVPAVDNSARVPGPPSTTEVLGAPGQPMDASTRSFMEKRFGHDFSQVRIHADPRAAESARAVGALAYTVGRNIVFGEGEYSPASSAGRRLLAHELAHVVQQTAVNRPRLQRQPTGQALAVNVAQLKSEIKKRGNPDITALINAFPNQLMNGGTFTLPDSVLNGPNPVDGTNHIFTLTFAIFPGAPPLYETVGAGVGENPIGGVTTGRPTGDPFDPSFKAPPPATTTHKVTMTLYQAGSQQRNYDPAETLYHELTHLRLIIDSYLPVARRSPTGQKYMKMLTVATEGKSVPVPQELAPAKTADVGGARTKVLNGIGALRTWFTNSMRGTFDNTKVKTNIELLEFLVNEKFANQAANQKLKNSTIASRYANAVRGMFVEASDRSTYTTAHGFLNPSGMDDDPLRDKLQKALEEWYDSIDLATSGPSGTAAAAAPNPIPLPLPAKPRTD
ncbi:MAG: DUF4157 domain-containing protein [Acidobacteria bacterium]|nr:DUF4157 domain-containing protein [Acidobacteriota bacterium]